MKKRKIVVIGLGKFGSYLARELGTEGIEVLAIDRNEKLVEDISTDVAEAIVGDATRKELLKGIGVAEAEKVIVATGNLSASVLMVLYLKELGVKSIMAKANDEDHARILELLGANNIVIPEKDAALKEARNLIDPNLLDFLPLLPDFIIARIESNPEFIGKSIRELDLRNRMHLYILAIRDILTDRFILLPPADHIIEKDEELFVLGKKEYVEKLLEKI